MAAKAITICCFYIMNPMSTPLNSLHIGSASEVNKLTLLQNLGLRFAYFQLEPVLPLKQERHLTECPLLYPVFTYHRKIDICECCHFCPFFDMRKAFKLYPAFSSEFYSTQR